MLYFSSVHAQLLYHYSNFVWWESCNREGKSGANPPMKALNPRVCVLWSLEVGVALLCHCWWHWDSCRSGTLGLASASRHAGPIYDQQWAKWQLRFKIMSLFRRIEELFLSFLSAAHCHLKDNCPAGHFTHGGSLHPRNTGIFIELSGMWSICLHHATSATSVIDSDWEKRWKIS